MRDIIHSSLKLDVASFVVFFFPLGLSAMIQFYNFENGVSRYDRNVDWSDGISEDNKLITAELS